MKGVGNPIGKENAAHRLSRGERQVNAGASVRPEDQRTMSFGVCKLVENHGPLGGGKS